MNDVANGSSALAGSHPAVPHIAAGSETHQPSSVWALALGSIGVVYGDIGTSPLYAFREAVMAAGGSPGAVTSEAGASCPALVLLSRIITLSPKKMVLPLLPRNPREGLPRPPLGLRLPAV